MPNDDLKKLVRSEMARTGERYATARARLLSQRARVVERGLDPRAVRALRAVRSEQQSTRNEVASRADIDPLWVWLVETGSVPPPEVADRLIEAYQLGASVASLLRRAATARARQGASLVPRRGAFDDWADTFTLRVEVPAEGDGGRSTVVLRYVAVDGDAIWAAEVDAGERWWVQHRRVSVGVGDSRRLVPATVHLVGDRDSRRAIALLSRRYPTFAGLFEHARFLRIQASQRHDIPTSKSGDLSCPPFNIRTPQ